MHPTVTLEYFSETVKNQSHINSSIIAHVSLLCCHKDCLNNCFEKSEGPLDMGNQTDLIEYSDNWSLIGIILFQMYWQSVYGRKDWVWYRGNQWNKKWFILGLFARWPVNIATTEDVQNHW